MRSAGPSASAIPVWRARSAEESVDLLLTGRCGVLLVDMAAVSTTPATLISQIVEQFPDVVRGRRRPARGRGAARTADQRWPRLPVHAQAAHGEARRHVPARGHPSPRRAARIALDAAAPAARHGTARTIRPAQVAVRRGRPRDLPGAALAARRRSIEPRRRSAGARGLAGRGARRGPVVSRWPTPCCRAHVPHSRRAATSHRPARNALDLYAAVLLAKPDQAEARAGLDRTIDHVVSVARLAEADGNHAEARRLLRRLESIDPSNRAVHAAGRVPRAPPPRAQTPPLLTTTAPRHRQGRRRRASAIAPSQRQDRSSRRAPGRERTVGSCERRGRDARSAHPADRERRRDRGTHAAAPVGAAVPRGASVRQFRAACRSRAT